MTLPTILARTLAQRKLLRSSAVLRADVQRCVIGYRAQRDAPKANRKRIVALATGATFIVLLSARAMGQAQEADVGGPSATDDSSSGVTEEIIVTGTLLRGITPPGAQTLSIGREDAIATGATSTAQLLANVPQIGDFNKRPINQGVQNTQLTVNHPDLRNLGALFGGGGSPTLLLVDGHRLPGMGVRQTVPDSDAIPPGAIERVEIVTDGGSATYGADAVGGVVNYITRRRFDGVLASGRYGFASDYQTAEANLTVGDDWGSGSLYGTYSYSWHDEIYGRDRDFVQRRDWQLGVPLDLTCNPGNVSIGAAVYALPDLTPGVANRCDVDDAATIYPYERRHSLFVGFMQELGDATELDVRAYYTNRINRSDGGPLSTTASIFPTSPFYRSTGDANAGQRQTVSLDFSPVLGDSTLQQVELETWGVAPELTVDFGSDWQLRGLLNYGRGVSTVHNHMVNTGLFAQQVAMGVINPYDLAAPSNAAALEPVINWSNYGKGEHELANVRAVVDGGLFNLPGGDVRVALGAEYLYEDYEVQAGVGPRDDTSGRPSGGSDRNTKAFFGEVLIPIFGENNRVAGIHSLALSASGRYDDYSDFGSTFNPKFALTWAPIESLKVRGNWGESFQAPSLADGAGAVVNGVTALPIVISPAPDVPPAPGQAQIFLSGGGVDLRPQEATTWSVGVDFDPSFIDGFSTSLTYYDIEFKDLIAIPPVTDENIFYSLYTEYFTLNPTIDEVLAFAAQAPNGLNAVAPYVQVPGQVYVIADGRRANFSSINTRGLDFTVRYDRPTGFGSIYGAVTGNYILEREEQPRAGAPFVSTVDNFTRMRASATLGTTIADLRAQATLLHSGGFDVTPTAANLNQSEVGDFNVVNLFFQYDLIGLGGAALLDGLSLTLNVDNLFDEDPPVYRESQFGYANGFTLGRLVQFGFMKTF